MKRCPCGCGGPVKPHRKFAMRTCWHRAVTPAQRASWGQQGGKTRVLGLELTLLAQLASLDRNAAILRAYYLGRRAAYRRGWQRKAVA